MRLHAVIYIYEANIAGKGLLPFVDIQTVLLKLNKDDKRFH